MFPRVVLALVAFGIIFCPGFALAGSWLLDHSTVTYTTNHPLKTTVGTSTAAKGKGKCEKGKCEFLIAAPVKSFDSGDTNRDLHMLEVTRGGANPLVVVRTSFDEAIMEHPSMSLTFNIEFAGKQASYSNVPFTVEKRPDGSATLKGIIPLKLSDFEITPPSLLAMPIKDEVPIGVDALWKPDSK